MARQVIARRNGSSLVMDIVLASVGGAALIYLLYMSCTAKDTGTIVMGAIVSAIVCAVAVYYSVRALLAARTPSEALSVSGQDVFINGEKYSVADISATELKERRKSAGEFSCGDIYVYFKGGKRAVCRGVADARNSYKKFCSLIGGNKKG